MKPSKAIRKFTFAIIFVVIAFSGVSSFLLLSRDEPNTKCGVAAIPKEIKATNNHFYIPCEISVTAASPSQTNTDSMQKIIQPIQGTVEVNEQLAESGLYYINVPPDTEESAIKYLKTRPEIMSAARNSCCASTTTN